MSNSVRDKIKEQVALEEEYERLSRIEVIYLSEVYNWKRFNKISTFLLLLVSTFLLFGGILLMPKNVDLPVYQFVTQYPLEASFLIVGTGLFILSALGGIGITPKISKIKEELGLSREELMYLRAFETYDNRTASVKEPNPKRKNYYKSIACSRTKELSELLNQWKNGNIQLIRDIIGKKISLLKYAFEWQIVPNIEKGNEETVDKIATAMINFCKYLLTPSVTKLEELNNRIKVMNFEPHPTLTSRELAIEFLRSKPRLFRFCFAFGITTILSIILLFLEQNLAVIVAVSVTCFWGAFSAFDKIFRIKGKEARSDESH